MFCSFGRIILESDPVLITQRVQLRQDDIPLGEQTVSQVSLFEQRRENPPSSYSTLINEISPLVCPSGFLSGLQYVLQR
jgi:hypothetical protein